MAAAAATAAIAPLALLSAPAAFADESTSPTPTETVTSEAPTEIPSGTASASAPETQTPPASTETPGSSASASVTPSGSASASTEPEPSETAEPSEDPSDPDVPFCEDLDENFGNAKVSADIKGLPGKIVAGDGFHDFKLVVTNDSKADVKGVAFYAEVENYELDESKYLSPYVDLEFKNPEDGSWDRIGSDDWAGDYFFYVEKLKSGASQSIDLRVSIDAKAPAGDAYSFGSGAYLDNVKGQDCIAEGWAQYDFEVLKAGSSNPAPGDATPSDNGSKDSPKKPQGDVTDLPTGNLAETGSSSALPVLGLVGGVAVVAGAGAVFVVRRRKTAAGA
ncbi:LAETG motif-containing sortase-dependent surface protein [Streptomyces sp. HUAS TT20]|uniref:LAETG motif-containing sortase-dependent surface protein n=1 Tax=Streptomyces sp. HUAS TT20 TaxID=3447509 RepID=UPI0021DAC951|nr:LAETG motif-containing sortase-dependent surface protein [Streptomyces sp. HUAS 15-9]UXY29394.1 LPXTG cell wall anchor domain-containing protein [Streptomyces sp. HUAS 15-9]